MANRMVLIANMVDYKALITQIVANPGIYSGVVPVNVVDNAYSQTVTRILGIDGEYGTDDDITSAP